jgi:pimeloyl-ACP methyl ester carboxylesterase
MQVLSTDGVTVAVHDLGGEGEPLLIAHATGFCGMAYSMLGAELTERFHVWAMDFRAHGDSTVPAGERLHWDGMADDLLAVLDALSDAPVPVVGHSLGGAASVLAENRRPGTLRWAYLFEPIVLPAPEGPVRVNSEIAAGAARRYPSFPSRADALLRYAGRPPLDMLRAGALFSYVEHGLADSPDGSVRLKCTPEHEAAVFDADGKPHVGMLATIQTPITVASGRTDRGWTPAEFAPSIAAALPHGRLERHPTIGHFGPLEDPVTIGLSVLAAAHA